MKPHNTARSKHRILKWILWYVVILILAVLLYFVGWLFRWHYNGQPDIVELRSFIDDIVSAPWIAMLGVVAQYFVDRNNDGVPDILDSSKTSDREDDDKGDDKTDE